MCIQFSSAKLYQYNFLWYIPFPKPAGTNATFHEDYSSDSRVSKNNRAVNERAIKAPVQALKAKKDRHKRQSKARYKRHYFKKVTKKPIFKLSDQVFID